MHFHPDCALDSFRRDGVKALCRRARELAETYSFLPEAAIPPARESPSSRRGVATIHCLIQY